MLSLEHGLEHPIEQLDALQSTPQSWAITLAIARAPGHLLTERSTRTFGQVCDEIMACVTVHVAQHCTCGHLDSIWAEGMHAANHAGASVSPLLRVERRPCRPGGPMWWVPAPWGSRGTPRWRDLSCEPPRCPPPRAPPPPHVPCQLSTRLRRRSRCEQPVMQDIVRL